MFRTTDDPSSGSLVQCLAKTYKNDSIVFVDMDRVGVMATYCDCGVCVCVWCVSVVHCIGRYSAFIYSDHVNGHDRIIFVIFNQALYKSV